MPTKRRCTLLPLLVFLAPFPGAQQAGRPLLTFDEVADSSTPVPGGTGTFTLFGDARDFDGRNVVFYARDSGSGEGLYLHRKGRLRAVVDDGDLVPGTGTPYSIFFDVALDGPNVVYTAGWAGGSASGCAFSPNEGLFLTTLGGGPPITLADSNATGYACFHGVDIDAGQVVVTGGNAAVDVFHNHQEALLGLTGLLSLVPLVDTATPVPGGGGATFAGFDQEVALRDGGYAFGEIVPNSIPPLMGVYVDDGTLRVVADSSTPVPEGSGAFQPSFRGMNYDGRKVAFYGVDALNRAGIYAGTGPDDLEVLVKRGDPVPGTPFTFLGFSNPLAYDDGVLAFTGFWSGGGLGLFWSNRGEVKRLLVKGDPFDGRVVEQAFCAPGHLVGNRMLIKVVFAGFTESGLYLVNLPIPG